MWWGLLPCPHAIHPICSCDQLRKYPQDVIPIFDIVLNTEYARIAKDLLAESDDEGTAHMPLMRARVFNLPKEEQVGLNGPTSLRIVRAEAARKEEGVLHGVLSTSMQLSLYKTNA